MKVMTFVFVAALAAVELACEDSNSISGAHLTNPPTPTPIPDLAGEWNGIFDPASQFDCLHHGFSAQAAFTVNAQGIVGVLNAPGDCGFANVVFQGGILGNTIAGTLSGDNFLPGSSASGVISGSTTLDLTLTNNDPTGQLNGPGGTMHLTRRILGATGMLAGQSEHVGLTHRPLF